MPLILPNDIEPLTPADAAEVEQNYGVIEQYMNTNVITRDGAVAMTAPLTLFGSPTQAQQAAPKSYVDALLPIGVVLPWGGAAAPVGDWRLCNGAALTTSAFPKLFAVLGYRYGGSGGNFNLPDLRGRVIICVDAGQTRFNTTGKEGGSWETPLRKHNHGIGHNHGSFNSGNASVGHTHDIDHNHPAFTIASSGAHVHEGRFLNVRNPVEGAAYGAFVTSTSALSGRAQLQGGDGADGAHSHSVDIPATSGMNSGGQSATHHHAIDMPAFTGNSTDTGTSDTEHLPPYTVLQYIIRTD